ncbi:MAG TPA: CusA/CzcA family heavy metal efflux RND transporter [Candidatus Sulfopaludibacter sp.]|jgi:cobalt-zinc-cadmium resistance protein CzcA|nr:CusA/CzcA family heavy metal efflux RND transporter [Candidatus Sulfopaludibacter sp.]
MIANLVSFALRQRFLIVIASIALMIYGALSFQKLPIDAYPDLSPPHVEIITQWPGHAAEEVERLVTIPLEIEMNGIPQLDSLRSISLYGLSSVQMNFEYGANPYFVREQAFERVGNATLPSGLQPSLSPLFSPSGLIYRYVLQSPDRSPQDLKILEDWVVERHFRSIQGVADDSGFGGTTMQYQVLLDPNKLFAYGLNVAQVTQQLGNNNANAGGGFYSQGGQFYYIRGLGLVRNTDDIGNIVLQQKKGIPIYVKDIADVKIGYAPRLGQFGYMKQDEAVEGVILMRVGEQAQVILRRVEAMTKDLNEHVLPPDVKVVPYYDRQALIGETTKTVEDNLLRGMLLVLVILGIFLFSVRTALIVAVTIPFALLFSFICLDWRHIPANLLSIGAIDFGIIVDGAVVMVENIFRELAERRGGEDHNVVDVIRAAAHDVERPIFYAIAVIIAGYIPIYVLSGPSGRLFQPMADTMSFALLGSLLCSLTLLPVLCSYFLRKHIHEPRVIFYEWIRDGYGYILGWCLRNRVITVLVVLCIFGSSLLLIPYIGGEFMPHLDEGALWVRATTPYTISFEEASKLSPQIRDILLGFPQVTTVANELGRPDDGTDPTGFFNNEFYVGLKPYSDKSWTGSVHNKAQLIEQVQKKLETFPGIIFNYTQPAEDAVDEAETGLKSALAVKIFGQDLATLEGKAFQVKNILSKIPGITEITVVRELGQPSLIISPDRAKLARYGLNVSDVNTLVETAMGGTAATQVIQGERQFDLIVRMLPQYRSDETAIKNLLIATPDGQNLPLSQFCDIHVESGASFIYRESNERYIGVQFSVEGRDLASAVGEARRKVDAQVKLPIGYKFDWGGEYKDYLASQEQMKIILPMTVLLILLILFALYGNLKFPLIIFLSVLVTEPVGGLLALYLTGTNFSVSSMLGFVALMGVAVQTSVILYSFINKLRLEGRDIPTATLEASMLRLRPIMMTALVACFGLLPAAMSTGVGSDSQKPFAIVIVAGLASRLLLSIFLSPVLYALAARDGDTLQV